MIQKKIIYFSILILSLIIFTNCTKQDEAQKSQDSVFVSITPQKYFIDRITNNEIKTQVMVAPGKSPSTYEPLPNQVIKLSKSDVFFTIGLPFERSFLPKIKKNLPNLLIIDVSEGIKKITIEEHDHHDEENHEGETEEHEEMDPHTWLSPRLVIEQIKTMKKVLIELYPDKKETFEKGYESLSNDLINLDQYLSKELSDLKNNIFFVYHPTYGYFAKEYNLKQISIETGGKEASSQKIKEIIDYAKINNVKNIFVQPEFSIKSANTIANAISAEIIKVQPLAYEYIENLKSLANSLK